jgi:hypothetical protein
MTKEEVEKFLKNEVLPSLSGFRVSGRLCYRPPATNLLRGLFLDQTSSEFELHLNVFVQPLYVPSPCLYFNFGERVGDPARHNMRWNLSPNLRGKSAQTLVEVIKGWNENFLVKIETPHDLALYLEPSLRTRPDDLHLLEALAYSRILSGDAANAVHDLELLHKRNNRTYPWELELSARVAKIKSLLLDIGLEAAKNQLYQWEEFTKAVIKLR